MRKKLLRLSVLLIILFLAGQAAFQSVKKAQHKRTVATIDRLSPAVSLPEADSRQSFNSGLAVRKFVWQYRAKQYELNLDLSEDVYQLYQGSPHFYQTDNPAKDWFDDFYAMFLEVKSQDKLIALLVERLRQIATDNKLDDDALAELTMAFVQSIDYDYAKVSNRNRQVNYPYETLYKKSGVCSDKSILAVLLLRRLGYGAAILVYPDRDHAAVGIACPSEFALPQTNYCYVETTAFLPIGFIPKDFSQSGAALAEKGEGGISQFNELFTTANLGKQLIYQATQGRVYSGIIQTRQAVVTLKNLKSSINAAQPELDKLKKEVAQQSAAIDDLSAQLQSLKQAEKYEAYNGLIGQYNDLITAYNNLAGNYKIKIDSYNNMVNLYNQAVNDLYVAGD